MVGRFERRTDRGVSPVIGVVLIVAIAVMLASTVGYFAFGMTDDTSEAAPQVAITTTYDESTTGDGQSLTVEFNSGDTLDAKNVSFALQGAVAVDSSGSERPVELADSPAPLEDQAGTHVAAGDRVVVDASSTTVTPATERLDLSDATLRLVWRPVPEEVEHSETIWKWTPE